MEEHLKKLVTFYPVTSEQENVKELLEYVNGYLAARGMKAEIITHNGVNSLYAHPQGKKKAKLLLQAHVDVVPSEKPAVLKIQNSQYKARGVYDMLYATACYLHLVDELKDNLQALNLGIMLSGDEERGGFNSVPNFLEKGYGAEVCLLPDAGAGFGTMNVSAKGMFGPKIRIHGKSHHGSRPWEGDGAAIKLVNFLKELDDYFSKFSTDDITMTVASLKSGDADNKGPAYADTALDIRYRSKEYLEEAKKHLDKLLKKYNGEITSAIAGSNYSLDVENVYIKKFIELYQQHLGKPVEKVMAHGSSDARFFAEKNIPIIMLRPDGGGAHSDEEWISIDSMQKFYTLLKDFVKSVATIESKDE